MRSKRCTTASIRAAPTATRDADGVCDTTPAPAQPLPWRRRAPRDAAGPDTLSPVVRRLLQEHSLEPSRIRGTGARGRITRADVLAASSVAPPPEPPDGALHLPFSA